MTDMNKTVYLYDPATGAYLRPEVVPPNPLEPGKFLVPPNATEVPPPRIESGELFFRDGHWIVVEKPAQSKIGWWRMKRHDFALWVVRMAVKLATLISKDVRPV